MLKKTDIKVLLKELIIQHDYTLLEYYDNKICGRIWDFYLGYYKCFSTIKEDPINEKEFNDLIGSVILNQFLLFIKD